MDDPRSIHRPSQSTRNRVRYAVRCFRSTLVGLVALAAACAQITHAQTHPQSEDGFVLGASALWSRTISGAGPVDIYDGTVVLRKFAKGRAETSSTEGLDARTGRRLWLRKDAFPTTGSPLFLVVGTAIERVDARTGAVKWRSASLCRVLRMMPTYTAHIGNKLYVGCTGGEIFALAPSTGHILASARPMALDNYDQMIRLGRNTMGIAGKASGAFTFRRSAIVKRDTLSTIVAFRPDRSIIGVRNGEALIDDTCCEGRHSDSWPATIERVSLSSGKTMSRVDLHPYSHPLPLNQDLPGPGTVLVVGNRLYVATSSALFVYDLAHLHARPRMLYDNLMGLPLVIDNRYFLVRKGANGVERWAALLDAHANMRELWSDNTGAWIPTEAWESPQEPILSLEAYINGKRTAKIINLHNWKELQIDGDCIFEDSAGRYALTFCSSPPRPPRIQMYMFGTPTAPATSR